MKLLLKNEHKHETSSDLTKNQSLSHHLTAGEVTVMLCSAAATVQQRGLNTVPVKEHLIFLSVNFCFLLRVDAPQCFQ